MKFFRFEVLSDGIVVTFAVAGQFQRQELDSGDDYRVGFAVVQVAIEAEKSGVVVVFDSFFVVFAEISPQFFRFGCFQFILGDQSNAEIGE